MKKPMIRFAFILLTVVLAAVSVLAKDLKVSIAKMPLYAESAEKGVLVDFVKEMAKAEGVNIDIQVVPFARSMYLVKKGKTDFHLPLIKLPESNADRLEYDHSTETIFYVNFVLYSNKQKGVTRSKVSEFFIETDSAHIDYFNFKVTGSSCIECSLKKVDIGRVDGFIFADFASDPLVRKNNLKNIKRELYRVFEVKMILPRGGKGGETDRILTSAIKKLKKNGMFQKTVGALHVPYDNWQP